MTLSLFAYVGTVFVVDIHWGEMLRGSLLPHLSFRPEYIATEAGFLRFLKLAKIDAIIMPLDSTERSPMYSEVVGRAVRSLKDLPGVKDVIAGRYTVTVLNRSTQTSQ